ncbi:hypothetical protein DBR42_28375, partial [Pelomonas sp. HMWF004]
VAAARSNGSLKEIRLVGNSSLRHLLASHLMTELAQPGSFDIFFDTPRGSNHRAFAFRTKAAMGTWPAGTPVLVTKRELVDLDGGQVPLFNGSTVAHMLVDTNCAPLVGGASPTSDVELPGFLCSATYSAPAHAGLTDMGPSVMAYAINGGTGNSGTLQLDSQDLVLGIYGVAVNKKLYLALQKAQGLVPLSATSIDETPAGQPSLGKSFVAGALTGSLLGSGSSKDGWNSVIPAEVDANILAKRIHVCRFIQGAGAQAASNGFFAAAGMTIGSTINSLPVTSGSSTTLPSSALGTITTTQNRSIEAVEDCLATVEALPDSTGGAYGFAVLSLNTNTAGVMPGSVADKPFRFIKLSQVAPTRAQVNMGNYEFVYAAQMSWAPAEVAWAPSADVLPFLTALRQHMGAARTLAAMKPALQQGLLAQADSFTGPWPDLPADVQAYSSRVSRKGGNNASEISQRK